MADERFRPSQIDPEAQRQAEEDAPSIADGPLPQRGRSRLFSDDISQKSGNYIFTFGFPGSGKTTFHSFLTRYIMEEGPFKTEFLNKLGDGESDYDINRMVTTWKNEWREGRFPEPTPVGDDQIRELSFEVTPFQGVRTPLQFTFLEVSGEMLQAVLPTENQDPSLSRILRGLLENSNINLSLMLILNPDVHNNDELFLNFLSYMDNNLEFDIRARASLGILISKPRDALRTLKELRSGYDSVAELRGEYCEDFVEQFAKSTYRIWYDWPNPKKKMIGRLHLGEIEFDGEKYRLTNPDYASIGQIFGWVYHQFTGRKLGPTPLQRMLRWIKS
jgi:hypothetical protein